ncbi:MAG: BON domain-containing protein [Duodenibacillus sp.]|nr:BON domain-containing protein [Duodenibacillus sp.]
MRRLFVPVFFGLFIAMGATLAQAGNQEEANKIAQRLTQQYPQYSIDVAYQEGVVRLRGEIGSEAEKAEIMNFVRRIPKVRAVSETFTVSSFATAPAQPVYAEPANGVRQVYYQEDAPTMVGMPVGSSLGAPVGTTIAAPAAPAA